MRFDGVGAFRRLNLVVGFDRVSRRSNGLDLRIENHGVNPIADLLGQIEEPHGL